MQTRIIFFAFYVAALKTWVTEPPLRKSPPSPSHSQGTGPPFKNKQNEQDIYVPESKI